MFLGPSRQKYDIIEAVKLAQLLRNLNKSCFFRLSVFTSKFKYRLIYITIFLNITLLLFMPTLMPDETNFCHLLLSKSVFI